MMMIMTTVTMMRMMMMIRTMAVTTITTDDDDEDKCDDGRTVQLVHSHSEREENTPRIASDECPRETRAGGEALAFPVVSRYLAF